MNINPVALGAGAVGSTLGITVAAHSLEEASAKHTTTGNMVAWSALAALGVGGVAMSYHGMRLAVPATAGGALVATAAFAGSTILALNLDDKLHH